MSVVSWVRFGFELGAELWREHQRAKAAKAWAETRSTVRACPQCREVAYVTGQTTCSKCGQSLSR